MQVMKIKYKMDNDKAPFLMVKKLMQEDQGHNFLLFLDVIHREQKV